MKKNRSDRPEILKRVFNLQKNVYTSTRYVQIWFAQSIYNQIRITIYLTLGHHRRKAAWICSWYIGSLDLSSLLIRFRYYKCLKDNKKLSLSFFKIFLQHFLEHSAIRLMFPLKLFTSLKLVRLTCFADIFFQWKSTGVIRGLSWLERENCETSLTRPFPFPS